MRRGDSILSLAKILIDSCRYTGLASSYIVRQMNLFGFDPISMRRLAPKNYAMENRSQDSHDFSNSPLIHVRRWKDRFHWVRLSGDGPRIWKWY